MPKAAKKKVVATKKRQGTREDVVLDLQQLSAANPGVTMARNFYRAHGNFTESVWSTHFPRFADYVAAANVNQATPEEPAEATPDAKLVFNGNHVYNQQLDSYIIFLDRTGVRLQLSGEQVRSMKAAYSDWDGNKQSINEICRVFGMRRDWFMEMKSVLGWTHDSEPFTEEELAARPEEDMVQDALQMRKLSLFRKFEQAKWQETKNNSDKWTNFEQNVFLPLMTHIEKNVPKYRVPMLTMSRTRRKFSVLMAPFDLHFGMESGAWEDQFGETYSRAQARQLLLSHTSELAEQIASFGRPESIICASASDYLHVDNQQHMTTRGTPQDVDGVRDQILIEGCELAVEHADMLRQIAPLRWVGVRGNHDYDSSISVSLYMRAWFKDTKGVTIDFSPLSRRYIPYGNSLVGLMHGHEIKPNDMHAVMSKEARDLWRLADHHYCVTGHLHHKVIHEIHGLTHIQLSSLAGKDRFHRNNGYITSGRALQAFIISEDKGIVAELISPVKNVTALTGVKVKTQVKK